MQKMRYLAVMVLLAVWASLLASASSVAAQQGSGEGGGAYPDTPADAYFAEPVAQLKNRGIFEGTLCGDGFCPSDPIDRKTVAVWVVRMLDGEDPPAVSESRFDDVDSAGFHARFIERMAVLGVTRGCGDGSGFCPDRHMTRAEMAVFLSRAYSLGDGPDPAFSDVPADAWYAADVARLANAGITVGCGDGTRFCPGRDTTRAQMATFLHRADNPDRIEEPGIAGDAISIGPSHGCAVKADQTIACWGDNTHGQASPPAGRFAAVAVESTYSCALRTDKTVVCWGENSRGRTDAPSGTYTNISASPHHPCALHTDGTIRCWGSSTFVYPGGQTTDRPPRGTFTDISLSAELGCAIKTDQSITCWGWTSRLGATPTGSFVAVDVHYRLACALRSDLTITCWGPNPHGQSDAPSGIHTAIATGRRHACALALDQRITCWGDQDDPQRVGAANVRNYGLTNAPIGTYRSIATTAWQTCALRDDDTYTCWGSSTPIDEDTVESKDDFARYIKTEIIDKYSLANPWLLDVWEYTNSPDFRYKIREGWAPQTLWLFRTDTDIPIRTAQTLVIPSSEYLDQSHEHFYINELANIYAFSNNVLDNPIPIAIAHLYFILLAGSDFFCDSRSLLADTLEHLAIPSDRSDAWSSCADLPSTPTDEAIAVLRDSWNGRIPEWFYDTFQDSLGQVDYEGVWSCVAYADCERTSGERSRYGRDTLLHQLRLAFGGYCSSEHVLNLVRMHLELQVKQPWRDGGCVDASPTQADGFLTAVNPLSRAVKELVDRHVLEHPWLQEVWDLTNNAEFVYQLVDRDSPLLAGASGRVFPGETFPDGKGGHHVRGVIWIRTPATTTTGIVDGSESVHGTIIHELAHVYTLSLRDSEEMVGIAAGWLYLHRLLGPAGIALGCSTSELYAELAKALVFGWRWPDPWSPCPNVPDQSSGEVLALFREAFEGRIPQWFYDTFEGPSGGLDYQSIWLAVKESASYDVVHGFSEAFGGYCSSIQEVWHSVDTGTDIGQPWIDGGCSS